MIREGEYTSTNPETGMHCTVFSVYSCVENRVILFRQFKGYDPIRCEDVTLDEFIGEGIGTQEFLRVLSLLYLRDWASYLPFEASKSLLMV